MSSNWQSWITLAIIALTAAIFVWRAIARSQKKGGGSACGSNCGRPNPSFKKKNFSKK